MAERAEIGPADEDQRQAKRRHEVERRAAPVKRDHDPADALDQQDAPARRDRRAAAFDHLLRINGEAFRAGRHIGRKRRAKTPGRDPREFARGRLASERFEKDGGVAAFGRRRIEAADDGL